jgi:hypothetical protein
MFCGKGREIGKLESLNANGTLSLIKSDAFKMSVGTYTYLLNYLVPYLLTPWP